MQLTDDSEIDEDTAGDCSEEVSRITKDDKVTKNQIIFLYPTYWPNYTNHLNKVYCYIFSINVVSPLMIVKVLKKPEEIIGELLHQTLNMVIPPDEDALEEVPVQEDDLTPGSACDLTSEDPQGTNNNDDKVKHISRSDLIIFFVRPLPIQCPTITLCLCPYTNVDLSQFTFFPLDFTLGLSG